MRFAGNFDPDVMRMVPGVTNRQKSEFLLDNGFLDFIVDRRNLKNKIYKLLSLLKD